MLRWLAVAIGLGRSNFEDLETILLEWFQQARAANLLISGPILKEKAEEIAGGLQLTNFLLPLAGSISSKTAMAAYTDKFGNNFLLGPFRIVIARFYYILKASIKHTTV